MDFVRKLNQALGLLSEQTITPEQWAKADPETIRKVAYTTEPKTFWAKISDLAKETGSEELRQSAEKRDLSLLKTVRREARTQLEEPETVEAEPEMPQPVPTEKEPEGKSPTPEKTDPKQTFIDDKLWGVFDKADRMIRGGWVTKAEADAYVATEIDDPKSVEIKDYENIKSLRRLKNVKGPLFSGWTEDEVVKAMIPYIKHIAKKYASNRAEFDDLTQHGAIGVMNALRTDKSEAPFGTHAFKHILGEIRRAAFLSGTVKGSEVPGGISPREGGGLLGYEVLWQKPEEGASVEHKFFPADLSAYQEYFSDTGRTPPRSVDPQFKAASALVSQLRKDGYIAKITDKRSGLTSAQAGAEEEGEGLAGIIPARVRTPIQIVSTKDEVERYMELADLTPNQETVIKLAFGLDQPEEEWRLMQTEIGKRPGEQAGKEPEEVGVPRAQAKPEPSVEVGKTEEGKPIKVALARGPTDVGRMLGVSGERVRILQAKALAKLRRAALEVAKRQAVGAAESIEVNRNVLFERFFRRAIIEMIISGDMNGVILG